MDSSIELNNVNLMKITLNGQVREFPNTPNLQNIIGQFCKNKNPVIAELNGEIIKNPQWGETTVKEGDTIELVSFVGGGSFVTRCPSLKVTHFSSNELNNGYEQRTTSN